MARIVLGGSVGKRGANSEDDVNLVRARLRDLGFTWISATGKGDTTSLVGVIKLFQAIIKGETKLNLGAHDGKIDVGGKTHKWLAAENAPRWVQVLGQSNTGWRTTDLPGGIDRKKAGGTPYLLSNGGWGTSWILDMLNTAGRSYRSKVAATVDCIPSGGVGGGRPGDLDQLAFANWFFCEPEPLRTPMPPMWVRDCAPERAGNASYHGSHETGLDVDIRLPRKDWSDKATATNVPWKYMGTEKERRKDFNRSAARLQLEALSEVDNVTVIGFEDDTTPKGGKKLHRIKKVATWKGHKDHFHVRIKPPALVAGQITA